MYILYLTRSSLLGYSWHLFIHYSRLSIAFGISLGMQRVSSTGLSMYVFRSLPLPRVPWLGCRSITSATISRVSRVRGGRWNVVFGVVSLYLTSEYFHTDPLLFKATLSILFISELFSKEFVSVQIVAPYTYY